MPIPAVVPLAPFMFWIRPPVQSAESGPTPEALPGLAWPPHRPLELPLTVRPPLAPVLFNTIPLAGSSEVAGVALPEEMLWNQRPLAAIAVLTTFSAMAEVAF